MAEVRQRSLNVLRGLAGAAIAAIVAGTLVAALAALFLACKWAFTGASAYDHEYDLHIARARLPLQAIGCAVVAGCAGWAAFAPVRRPRFAWTLTVVFVGSVAMWSVVGALDLVPHRLKSVNHPFLYRSEALLLFGPPVLMAGVMTLHWVRQSDLQDAAVKTGTNTSRT